jgi:peptidoglycan hydrolase-like protein with peptidoglycan-binding domain
VAKVETLITQIGNLDLRQTDCVTGYYGERLKQATEGFQKDNNLKTNGLIGPRGGTMHTMTRSLKANKLPLPKVSISSSSKDGAPTPWLQRKLHGFGVENADELSKPGRKEMKYLIDMVGDNDSVAT